ncbi:hypothetical protein D3C87_1107800 [compost metagenome]
MFSLFQNDFFQYQFRSSILFLDLRTTKWPACTQIHVDPHTEFSRFICCCVQHIHPFRRKEIDVFIFEALRPINRRNFYSTKSTFFQQCQFTCYVFLIYSRSQPPPSCPRFHLLSNLGPKILTITLTTHIHSTCNQQKHIYFFHIVFFISSSLIHMKYML